MVDVNKQILQKASGENRLNPDEQRYYMGTFRERVLLVIDFEEANSPYLKTNFQTICKTLEQTASPLFLKISPALPDVLQIPFMKEAQDLGITCGIIDEKIGQSPFALLFHTDHALDIEKIQMEDVFPKLLEARPTEETKKKSFWSRLFGE